MFRISRITASIRLGLPVVFLMATGFVSSAIGQTTFNGGGSVFAPSQWSNGLPSVGNNGTIGVNGDFSGTFNFGQNTTGMVTINITGGTLNSSSGANFYNGPVDTSPGWATFNWNQTGGTVSFDGGTSISPNLRTTYTLSGGAITNPNQLGSILPYNGGRFNQTGGTVDGMRYALTDNTFPIFGLRSHTFSGGTGTNITGFQTSSNNMAIVDGSFTLTFRPIALTSDITTFGVGVMNFQDTWTGSWARDNFTLTDWQTIFTRNGMQFEGIQITSANFSTIFEVTNSGAAGSSIRSLAAVPEPSTWALISIVGIGGGATYWARARRENKRS